MDDKLISIIVPVYNNKNYVERCVNSILKQTYSNIEIILVDDGSTDGSAEICNELSVKNEKVIMIHKKNGGVSSARNTGINICKGEYIGFVDSDDYVEEDMYELLFRCMKKFDAEISFCSIKEVENKGTEQLIDRESLIWQKYPGGGFIWNCLYKKDIIDKFDIRFDENLNYGEDMVFILKYITNMNYNKVAYVNKLLYHYKINDSSVSNFRCDYEKRDKNILSWMESVDISYSILIKFKKSLKKELDTRYVDHCLGLFLHNRNITCKDKIISKAKIFKDSFNFKQKVYYFFARVNPNILYVWGNYIMKIFKKNC